jgi:hypothetical protein
VIGEINRLGFDGFENFVQFCTGGTVFDGGIEGGVRDSDVH